MTHILERRCLDFPNLEDMIIRQSLTQDKFLLLILTPLLCFVSTAIASIGDRLPEFRNCVSVGPSATSQGRFAEYARSVLRRTVAMAMLLSVSISSSTIDLTLTQVAQI